MKLKTFTLAVATLALTGCSSIDEEGLSCPYYLTNTSAQKCVGVKSIQDTMALFPSLKSIKEL